MCVCVCVCDLHMCMCHDMPALSSVILWNEAGIKSTRASLQARDHRHLLASLNNTEVSSFNWNDTIVLGPLKAPGLPRDSLSKILASTDTGPHPWLLLSLNFLRLLGCAKVNFLRDSWN